MKRLNTLILLVGLGFAVFLVHRLGVGELWRQLTHLRFGLVLLLGLEGLAELLHTVSWRYCLGHTHRSISLIRLFRISMAGYAISYFTPTASVGGDVTKVGLLALHQKGPEAVTGVLIGKLSFALAHAILVILGSVVVLPRLRLPFAVWIVLLAGGTLMALGIIVFLSLQKNGNLGAFTRWLVKKGIGGHRVREITARMNNIDEALKLFYHEQPWGLAWSVIWHLLGYAVGIIQVFYFLQAVGPSPTFSVCAQIWFVGMWFDLLTFMVPMNLGALETSRIITFRAAAYMPVVGITYALVTRLSQLLWSAFGLASYASLISTRTLKSKASGNRFPGTCITSINKG